MKVSDNGINLIKQFEGCVLHAYKCVPSEEYYTIGYGHYGADVGADQTITQETAESMLRDDIKRYEALVNIYQDRYNFNQNEYDAMVSFCYNIGSVDQLTQNGKRNKKEISDAMLLYVHDSAGNELEGLVNRRKKERELFLQPCDNAGNVWDSFSTKSTIEDIVKSILAGDLGNDEERKENIYNIIQHFVNIAVRG